MAAERGTLLEHQRCAELLAVAKRNDVDCRIFLRQQRIQPVQPCLGCVAFAQPEDLVTGAAQRIPPRSLRGPSRQPFCLPGGQSIARCY